MTNPISTLAAEHAAQLAGLGIYAQARPGTPLADLASYGRTGLGDEVFFTEDFAATCEGLADGIADAVRGYLDFARNTAKPALAALQEEVKEAIVGINFDPFSGLDIITVGAPELLENGDFLQSVSHYNSGSEVLPPVNPRFGPRTDDQLIEACMTGTQNWDNQIKVWLASLPEGHLQTVWQSVFMDKVNNVTTAPISTTVDLLNDYSTGKFSSLVIFLLASRIHQSPDDEIGLTLDQARQFLYALLQACATNINRGINWFNSFVGTSSLVIGMDRQARKIRVNAAVYKQYLGEGGKADVLMGMLVSGRKYNSVAEINANAESLMTDWSLYAQSRDAEAQAAYENQARSIMLLCFEKSLGVTYSELEAEQLNKPGAKATAVARFNALLNEYTREQIQTNWIDVLWRCACQARYYYHTTTYDLLDAIDYAVRVKGADPQDAATVAVQKVVSNFVAEMLKGVKAE